MQTSMEMSDLAAFLQLMKDGMRFMKADIQWVKSSEQTHVMSDSMDILINKS